VHRLAGSGALAWGKLVARVPVVVPDLGMETGACLRRVAGRSRRRVTAGEDLFEVEADKATVVCEAETSGVLAEIVVAEGPVKTGDLLGYIDA
jgi:pyruvate carboxylase